MNWSWKQLEKIVENRIWWNNTPLWGLAKNFQSKYHPCKNCLTLWIHIEICFTFQLLNGWLQLHWNTHHFLYLTLKYYFFLVRNQPTKHRSTFRTVSHVNFTVKERKRRKYSSNCLVIYRKRTRRRRRISERYFDDIYSVDMMYDM